MKRKELYDLADNLDSVRQSGSKFCYQIAKAKKIVNKRIEAMEKQIVPDPLYKDFINKLENVKVKHSEKDEIGFGCQLCSRYYEDKFIKS
jgi:hypothetical protein